MAAEYGALLKWPNNLDKALLELMGIPAILILKFSVLHEEKPQIHMILLEQGWNKDTVYEKCFEYIRPVKTKMHHG